MKKLLTIGMATVIMTLCIAGAVTDCRGSTDYKIKTEVSVSAYEAEQIHAVGTVFEVKEYGCAQEKVSTLSLTKSLSVAEVHQHRLYGNMQYLDQYRYFRWRSLHFSKSSAIFTSSSLRSLRKVPFRRIS